MNCYAQVSYIVISMIFEMKLEICIAKEMCELFQRYNNFFNYNLQLKLRYKHYRQQN